MPRVIFRGPLAAALQVPCEFPSGIAARFGLPAPTTGANYAEGVVVRPAGADVWAEVPAPAKSKPQQEKTAGNDDGSDDDDAGAAGHVQRRRLMLKRKHPMFREFVVAASRGPAKGAGATKDAAADDDATAALVATLSPLEVLFACVNHQRAASAASKLSFPKGTPEATKRAALLSAMADDAAADAELLLASHASAAADDGAWTAGGLIAAAGDALAQACSAAADGIKL